jgi:CDP-4-dehydro-6-deoxyglucose reductase
MPFQISVQPSGRFFDAGSDETLLMAGLRQGVGLPYGCKDGACGSCKCKKLSGTVTHGAHQSKALSEEEEANGMVLTCCATAQSDVVLESRQVVEAGAFPIKKNARAHYFFRKEIARCDVGQTTTTSDRSHAVLRGSVC